MVGLVVFEEDCVCIVFAARVLKTGSIFQTVLLFEGLMVHA